MRELWSESRKFQIWLEIETLACEAMADLGEIPQRMPLPSENAPRFRFRRSPRSRSGQITMSSRFLRTWPLSVGPAARWMHQGLTSSDILDTTLAVQLTEAASILIDGLEGLAARSRLQARKFKMTPMIGRSHGIHAEPITFGLKLALMFDEFGRAEQRLAETTERIRVGKLSGAVGTHAHLDPAIERTVCSKTRFGAGHDFHADHPAGSACGIRRDPRVDCLEHRSLGDGIPPLATTEVLEVEDFSAKDKREARRCRTNEIRLPANGLAAWRESFVATLWSPWKMSRFGMSGILAIQAPSGSFSLIRALCWITCW